MDQRGGLHADAARSGRLGKPPRSRLLGAGGEVGLREVTCSAGPHDRPFPEAHHRPCIALVCEGAFRYRSSAGEQILSPGWLLVGRTGMAYECSHQHGNGDRCLSLELSDEILGEVGSEEQGPAALPPVPRLEARLRLAAAATRGPAEALAFEQLGYEVAGLVATEQARWLGKRRGAGREPGRADRCRIEVAAEYLRANAREPLRLQDLAREAGMSPFHFLRLFHKCMGVTPHQLLIRQRLRDAVDLLLTTRQPVTEVAYEVGFGDLSNFVRTFHREVGCPPGGLRPRHGRSAAEQDSPSELLDRPARVTSEAARRIKGHVHDLHATQRPGEDRRGHSKLP